MKDYRVRIVIERNILGENEDDAKATARRIYEVDDDDCETDILREYRMPIRYNCCEEGHTYGYTYTFTKNINEAKFKFQDEWVEDIEASPCYDDIEIYDEESGEWL